MQVLSLFDGMACGMLAMQSAGVPVDRYVAFEIDKYAVQTSTHNFPMIEHRGDVFGADFTEFRGFDFLVGGSPCTYWSIAQKNNRETEASGRGWELFQQYVRALHEAQPAYFVYENNKSMSKAIRESIDDAFGFEAICINSALVSAQNRNRLYWVGKRNADGTYSKVSVEQPEEQGLLLKDVLECGHRFPEYGTEGKARPVNALYPNNCGAWWSRVFSANPNKQQVDLVAEPVRVGTMPQLNGALKDNQATRIYSIDGKAVTQSAQGGGWGAKTGLYAVPIEGYATPTEWDESSRPTKAFSVADDKTYQVYEVKSGQITIKGKQHPIKLADGFYIIRKLTVAECKRLQTVPGWYEFPVSNTQAYKLLGNGWTVDVIAWILSHIPREEDDSWMY